MIRWDPLSSVGIYSKSITKSRDRQLSFPQSPKLMLSIQPRLRHCWRIVLFHVQLSKSCYFATFRKWDFNAAIEDFRRTNDFSNKHRRQFKSSKLKWLWQRVALRLKLIFEWNHFQIHNHSQKRLCHVGSLIDDEQIEKWHGTLPARQCGRINANQLVAFHRKLTLHNNCFSFYCKKDKSY